MNYNTSKDLWENYRKHQIETLPYGGARLIVREGHVSNGLEILARFDDDKHAKTVLAEAGYREVEPNVFKG